LYDRVIRDTSPHGNLTVTEIVAKSSNIGAAKIGRMVGSRRLFEMYQQFGFGEKTGVVFPAESAGILRTLAKSPIDLASASYGHGLSVTALQLALAYRVFAKNGMYRRPTLIRAVSSKNEQTQDIATDAGERLVLSAATTAQVNKMLEATISSEGTGSKASVSGFNVAGKTGTAIKIDAKTGRYDANQTMAIFAGFAPVHEPKVVAVVILDKPKVGHTGGEAAAPVFAEIAQAAMAKLGVTPDPKNTALARAKMTLTNSVTNIMQAEGVEEGSDFTEAGDLNEVKPSHAESLWPSFVGLTARQALERYTFLELRNPLKLRGSGYVKKQRPQANSDFTNNQTLELTLGN